MQHPNPYAAIAPYISRLPHDPAQRFNAMSETYGRLMHGARSSPNKPMFSEMSLHDMPIMEQFHAFNPYVHDDPLVHEAREEALRLQRQEPSPLPVPDPLNVLITGRKGTGKTLVVTGMGAWWDLKTAYRNEVIKPERPQRVMSNYTIKPVQDRGWLAIDVPVYLDGEITREVENIAACDPDHPIIVAKFRPDWARDTFFLIDEIADVTSNLRATAAETRLFGEDLRQHRKQGREYIAATQFIHQMSRGQVAIQFDLLVRLRVNPLIKKHQKLYGIDEPIPDWMDYVIMDYFDFFSNVVDREKKYRSGIDWTMGADWRKRLWGITKAYPLYDTDNIIPPIWATPEQKERMKMGGIRYKQRLEREREGHGTEPAFDHTNVGDWQDAFGNERHDERPMITPEEGME